MWTGPALGGLPNHRHEAHLRERAKYEIWRLCAYYEILYKCNCVKWIDYFRSMEECTMVSCCAAGTKFQPRNGWGKEFPSWRCAPEKGVAILGSLRRAPAIELVPYLSVLVSAAPSQLCHKDARPARILIKKTKCWVALTCHSFCTLGLQLRDVQHHPKQWEKNTPVPSASFGHGQSRPSRC